MRFAALFLSLASLASAGHAAEPGSGVYAADCADLAAAFTIDIGADGSAQVTKGGATYSGLLTSYSFFGDQTPEDFRIAILFGDKASPVPQVEGRPGWIEIWNGESDFYALVNGAPDPQLGFCGDLAAFAPAPQTVDCAGGTGLARLICDNPALAAADSRLATALAAARDNVELVGVPKLDADQADWSRQRDACGMADDPVACLTPLYQARLALLSASYGLATAGVSKTYDCKGPVSELFVTPFATDPPSVELMVGQTRVAALLQPDGSSYAAPSGERFRPGGATAELDWPKGTVSSCRPQ
ncbi:MAG: hypothetical protein U1E34_02770 [Amaricoccus sp.]